MFDRNQVLKAAVAGLVMLGGAAANVAMAEKAGMEQCAGVIKAGKNDCATSTNACHGHVMQDANPEAWIYVPKGTCDKIAGGRVVVVKEPTPAGQE